MSNLTSNTTLAFALITKERLIKKIGAKMKHKNTFCWIDIPVIDLDRAIKFYSMILDEPVQKIDEHGLSGNTRSHEGRRCRDTFASLKKRPLRIGNPLKYTKNYPSKMCKKSMKILFRNSLPEKN
jgi:hypothetical protein